MSYEVNLLALDKELCKEWHFSKNEKVPENYKKSSKEKVWWKCDKGHEWEAVIHTRAYNKTGCPVCANKKAHNDNCFATKFPEMLKEWDYEKNDIMPTEVLPGSNKEIWWICKNKHSWKTALWYKTGSKRPALCPQCPCNFKLQIKGASYNEDKTEKRCKDCEKYKTLSNFRIKGTGRKGYFYNYICIECEKIHCVKYKITDRGNASYICSKIKSTSKKKNLPFDLDIEWILNRLNRINWCCELTKLPFQRLGNINPEGYPWNSISVDKIISKLGYIKSNVRFILAQVNSFKLDGDDNRMYMIADFLLKEKKNNV